ncbi:MAG: Ribosomal small subunit methyltransferase RsmB [Acidobacteria bacterium]|nr:Ribosomal small subunit methyltransferase RsmB [Acidobacteriota bacterium]
MVSPARVAAFEILQRVERDGAFASVLLASHAEGLQPHDRALCHELVMGVLRHQLWLDRLIGNHADRDPEGLDLAVRLALRLGLYQLRCLAKVPASAAVNESVNIVRRARLRSAGPFVNAVLRRATREFDFDPCTAIADPLERLAVETSHPLWLIQRWVSVRGFDETAAFARANNEPAPVAFRIVNETENYSAVITALQSAGVELRSSAIVPGAWLTSRAAGALQQLAQDGRVYIQDEASQLVAHVVGAGTGERVLDVCAAPGSKTTHIADLTRDGSIVVAADLYEHRLRTVVATAKGHHLANIQCVVLDARQSLPFHLSGFDRVLVDAPCTGTGTLRRNPEIRWRISPEDIEDLAARQIQILLNAVSMVRPGGRLIYSTCSVEPEENEHVIDKFFEQTAGFVPAGLPVNSSLMSRAGAARLWPHRGGSDGFFIAAFERE